MARKASIAKQKRREKMVNDKWAKRQKLCFSELALSGYIPGLTKASW